MGEPVFASISRLAAQLCNTPLAHVTLIDARRQWSRLDASPCDAARTAHEFAFCEQAIKSDQVLEVPHALADSRFAALPLVVGEGGIRFYAGAPLVMQDGARIGVLCVTDRAPRRLTEGQTKLLQGLAQTTAHVLGMRTALLDRARSSRSRIEGQLAESEGRQSAALRSVIEAIPAIVAVVGSDLRFRIVNSGCERWLKSTRQYLVGRHLREVLGGVEYERTRPWIERVLRGESVSFEKTCPENVQSRHLAVSYIPLRLEDGSVDGFVSVAQDITQHRQEEVRLLQLSQRDPLTGLLNRSGVEQFAQHRIGEGAGPTLACLCIDLDHFKPVNDEHGHPTGDALLQAFAQRLAGSVRPSDAVARLGGDEFVVVLCGIRDVTNAQTVAENIVSAAREPFAIGTLKLQIAASVGIAVGADKDAGWASFLKRADQMLYQAKRAGRGRCVTDVVGLLLV